MAENNQSTTTKRIRAYTAHQRILDRIKTRLESKARADQRFARAMSDLAQRAQEARDALAAFGEPVETTPAEQQAEEWSMRVTSDAADTSETP